MSKPNRERSNEEIALHNMEIALRRIEGHVPPPQEVLIHGNPALRYLEQTIQQAIVAKVARYISLLSGAKILMEHGQVHEQALLQRAMDESESDVTFLALGVIKNDITERHTAFLTEFWKEEYDKPTAMDSTQDRAPPKREKIRAYIAKHSGADPSTAIKADRALYKSLSGYVHGAAPHIMDLHNGSSFSVRGVAGSFRHAEHRRDLWNYYYRGLLVCAWGAIVFEDVELSEAMRIGADEFAQVTGRKVGKLKKNEAATVSVKRTQDTA